MLLQTVKKGMIILGCITAIEEEELLINLPNLMHGYVTTSSLLSMYDDNSDCSKTTIDHKVVHSQSGNFDARFWKREGT